MWKNIINWISKTESFITATIFISALIILTINIILRYFFRSSTYWAEEAIRFIMIWVTFLGVSLCVEYNLHVGIDVLIELTSNFIQNIFRLFAQMVGIFFSGFMTFFGIKMIIFLVNTGQRSSVLMMPMWIVYFCIPLGAFFIMLRYIEKSILYINLLLVEYKNRRQEIGIN